MTSHHPSSVHYRHSILDIFLTGLEGSTDGRYDHYSCGLGKLYSLICDIPSRELSVCLVI